MTKIDTSKSLELVKGLHRVPVDFYGWVTRFDGKRLIAVQGRQWTGCGTENKIALFTDKGEPVGNEAFGYTLKNKVGLRKCVLVLYPNGEVYVAFNDKISERQWWWPDAIAFKEVEIMPGEGMSDGE